MSDSLKRGRKALPAGERRNHLVAVNMNDAELQKTIALAKKYSNNGKENLAGMIRQLISDTYNYTIATITATVPVSETSESELSEPLVADPVGYEYAPDPDVYQVPATEL